MALVSLTMRRPAGYACVTRLAPHAPRALLRRNHAAATAAQRLAPLHCSSSTSTATTETTEEEDLTPQQVLDASQLSEWAACCQLVQDLGLSAEDADRCIIRAFGWSGQFFWRQEKVGVWARCRVRAWQLVQARAHITNRMATNTR